MIVCAQAALPAPPCIQVNSFVLIYFGHAHLCATNKWEDAMETMNRRSAIALGVTAAAVTPLFALATPASAKEYGPNDGKEIAPGVRLVEVGTGNSDIPAYKSISIVDVVFQPGAVVPEMKMDNDMVCTIAAGEFTIKKTDKEFNLKEGDMYTCAKGKTDAATNTSAVVGVHRIAVLIPA
jgi:quercetin dioxygenase-like cupin family protein